MIQAALFVFVLRLIDVSAMTLRILMVMRGRKLIAWILGFFQALVFVVAIREVLSDVSDWMVMIGYAGGFATGTVIGMRLEEWLAVGYGHVRITSARHGAALAEALRGSGYAVTEVSGRGRDGTVDMINCSVPRRQVSYVTATASRIDPDAFITVEDVRGVWHGFFRPPRTKRRKP
jgi:uncharacterized protein YebE (UPF0316 family)